MEYSRQFGSTFPDGVYATIGTKRDVDDTVVDLINQYYAYIDAGDITSAKGLYDTNVTTLEPYMINMAYVNALAEEIYNIALYTQKQITSVISDVEPSEQPTNGFWYQDYE